MLLSFDQLQSVAENLNLLLCNNCTSFLNRCHLFKNLYKECKRNTRYGTFWFFITAIFLIHMWCYKWFTSFIKVIKVMLLMFQMCGAPTNTPVTPSSFPDTLNAFSKLLTSDKLTPHPLVYPPTSLIQAETKPQPINTRFTTKQWFHLLRKLH